MRRQPSLRSQLNQIRLWVRQGRTDAWIAHKLDVSIDQLARFKRDHDLENGGAAPAPPADPLSVPPPEPEPDEPEDEEPDFEEPEEPEEPEDEPEPDEEYAPAAAERRPRRRPSGRGAERPDRGERSDRGGRSDRGDRSGRGDRSDRGGRSDQGERDEADGDRPPGARRPGRRRGRRGGRGRRARTSSYEATFDHGDEGYGLWLDPAVVDNPVYTEHWAGHRDVKVTVERDSITIRRAGPDAEESATDADSED